MTCSSFSTAACRLLMLVLMLALPTLPRMGRIGESSIASKAWSPISSVSIQVQKQTQA